jgi:hypothetical protein
MKKAVDYFNLFELKIGFRILCILLFSVLLVAGSCAAQHKYKKIKSVPCPCEKLNKRQ